jgi:dimethylaniline monooxygenase (N-oxide forming)
MQSRYFALLCSNKRTLPPREKLEELIQQENTAEEAEFPDSRSLKTLVPYMAYMDAMAGLIGCKPNPLSLLTRPALLYKYWCASLVNDQYRLRGPHADPESAERVMRSQPVPRDTQTVIAELALDVYALSKRTALTLQGKRPTVYQS